MNTPPPCCCYEVDRWSVALLSAPPPVPPYLLSRRRMKSDTAKSSAWSSGRRRCSVIPDVSTPAGGSDALQHLSAGRGLSLHLQHPDNSYCSSRPTYSKQGGGPVINKSSLSALNASLEAGYIKDPTYTDMSAPSDDGRKTRSSGHMTDTSSPTYVIMWEKGGADVVNTLNTAWWFICTSQTDHLSTWTRKVCVWECYLGTHTKIWLVGIKLWC